MREISIYEYISKMAKQAISDVEQVLIDLLERNGYQFEYRGYYPHYDFETAKKLLKDNGLNITKRTYQIPNVLNGKSFDVYELYEDGELIDSQSVRHEMSLNGKVME